AVVLPEQNLRVTYGELYAHVQAVAEQLSAAGVGRGDRIGMALTNGLPMIVAFLAASEVGTAAPLNPAYTESEFRFYLEDTSGSTGRPKRVPLSHANLSISAANVARCYDLGEDDVSMCVMPLFHVHGLVASTLATFASGGTVVVPEKFRPLAFWRIARDYGMT